MFVSLSQTFPGRTDDFSDSGTVWRGAVTVVSPVVTCHVVQSSGSRMRTVND